MSATLAIDFGTSNSAVAILEGGQVRRIPIETGSDTLPTAVFFPVQGPMLLGEVAGQALIDGEEGRYMRALKSVLGTSLLHQERTIGGKRRTLADIVTAFLAEVKARAEAETGARFDRVLSGRPVHFHSHDPERDARAQDDLSACYRAAGFNEVAFRYEPEAAAIAAHGLNQTGGKGLIVDIGGGTSDFTVFGSGPNGVEIMASHGIRLGGTDFDQTISLAQAMPLLGLGGTLRRTFGSGELPVPNGIYADLATWAKIPFLYTPETRRLVAEMLRDALEPERVGRLDETISEELGHELAFAVERGKIAANRSADAAAIDMEFIERGLTAPMGQAELLRALAHHAEPLRDAITRTLATGGVAADEIASIVLVGGSSLMGMVEDLCRTTCRNATLSRSEAFTAVVDGLALATAGR